MNMADDLRATILSQNYMQSVMKQGKTLQNKQEIDFF